MKISHGFLALTLAGTLTSGCTTKKYYTNGDGGTAGEASVSNVTPSTAYLGRTLDVTLSGSGTNWSASTKVDFGAGITVNSLNVASASALVANITIANTAAAGKRDITVTDGSASEPYTMAFNVASAVEVTVQGTQKQGSVLIISIKNADVSHPFDTTSAQDSSGNTTFTNISITGPDGTSALIDNVTPFGIDAELDIDVMAKTGTFDLDIKSGPSTGTPDEFFYPAAFKIDAQTATTLTSGTAFALETPYASQLFTFTPAGANHRISFNAVSAGNGSPVIALLDSTGEWANLIDLNSPVSVFTSDTSALYAIVVDPAGASGVMDSVEITDVAYTLATEKEPNNTSATAQTLALAALVQDASLATAGDEDWYKIVTTAAGQITATTSAGDANTDTVITIYSADGTTDIADGQYQDFFDFFQSAVTDSVPAGTYYVKVSPGTDWASSDTKYNLDISVQ